MTTPAAERLYLAQHLMEVSGRPLAVFNPHDKSLNDLPIIYGFNNGGSPGWFSACLISADGVELGGHVCSSEGYMPHDLGLLEGSRADRHETFRKHYPDGYRMAWVPYADIDGCEGLLAAFKAAEARTPPAENNAHSPSEASASAPATDEPS